MLNNEVKVAVIGAGRWGIKHVNTAASILPHENIVVCDRDSESLARIKELYGNIECVNCFDSVMEDKSIDAVIVATPAESHFRITVKALNAGKHALVEKPITLNAREAYELLQLSLELNKKIMVGHVLLYHPAVKRIKEEIANNKIGKLQYIYANRLNLGALRSEENILWSFAPHDISVIQYLVGDVPIKVNSHGATFLQHDIEDTTLTYLTYPNNIHAHIFVSWLNPFKEQRMVIVGNKGMIVFEDSLEQEKLKFYPKGFTNIKGTFQKFENEYEVLEINSTLPLYEEQIHFFNCIKNDTFPLTNGRHAYEVLKILEQAQKDLKKNRVN